MIIFCRKGWLIEILCLVEIISTIENVFDFKPARVTLHDGIMSGGH